MTATLSPKPESLYPESWPILPDLPVKGHLTFHSAGGRPIAHSFELKEGEPVLLRLSGNSLSISSPPQQKPAWPRLMQNKHGPVTHVILMTAPTCGTLLYKDPPYSGIGMDVGNYSICWDPDTLEPFKGSLTLSEDLQ